MSLHINIHKIASQLIRLDRLEWRRAGITEISDAGIARSVHGEWVSFRAHIQPGVVSSFGGACISEKDYKDIGLDWSHKFYTVWIDNTQVSSIAEMQTTDQFRFYGKIFNIIQIADWAEFDGWRRCFCEQIIEEGNEA